MSFTPDGFQVIDLEQWEADEEDNERVIEDTRDVDTVSKYIERVLMKRTIVDGEEALVFIHLSSFIRSEVDLTVSNPSERASGHDWLTRVEDDGSKVSMPTIAFNVGGGVSHITDSGMGVGHIPAIANSDRYQGQQWRSAPIVDVVGFICSGCNIMQAVNGSCFCN